MVIVAWKMYRAYLDLSDSIRPVLEVWARVKFKAALGALRRSVV